MDVRVSDRDTSDEYVQPLPCASLCLRTIINSQTVKRGQKTQTKRVLILELRAHIVWLRWWWYDEGEGGGQEQAASAERCADGGKSNAFVA